MLITGYKGWSEVWFCPPLQVWGGISFDWVTAPYRGRNPVGANSTCSFWKPLLPGSPFLSPAPRVLSEWSFKLLVVRSLLFLSWHRVWFLQLQMRAGTMLLPKEQKVLDRMIWRVWVWQFSRFYLEQEHICSMHPPIMWTGMWICGPLSDYRRAMTLSPTPTASHLGHYRQASEAF